MLTTKGYKNGNYRYGKYRKSKAITFKSAAKSRQEALVRRIAARQALRAVRRAEELKYWINTLSETTVQYNSAVPTFFDTMMQPSQGTGVSNYAGHKVRAKYVKLQFNWVCNGTSAPIAFRFVVCKVINRRNTIGGTNYQVGEKLFDVNNSNQDYGTASGCVDTMQRMNRDMFEVVHDEVITVNDQSSYPDLQGHRCIKVDYNNRILHYDPNISSAPQQGNLVAFWMARRISGTDTTSQGVNITAFSEFVFSEP